MKYFVIILLLTGCAKTATESATESVLAQVSVVERAIKKECPTAKIDEQICALKSTINTQLKTCEAEQARIESDKVRWQFAFWALAIVVMAFFLQKTVK